MAQLSSHLRAALTQPGGEPVVKSDAYYGGYLSSMDDTGRVFVRNQCEAHGCAAEFERNAFGWFLRLRKAAA